MIAKQPPRQPPKRRPEIHDGVDYADVGPGSDEPFTFESSLGDITVPSMAVAPRPRQTKLLRAAAEENQAMIALLLLEAAAGDEMDTIDELPPDEQVEFLSAWHKHSGVGLGEFRAS